LVDIGVQPFLIASSVIAIMAQRLIRLVCPKCKEVDKVPLADLKAAGISPERAAGANFMRGRGCNHCNHTGQSGRHGVYELLDMTPRVVRALLAQDNQAYMEEARREIGQMSLAHHACSLVLRGATTVREVMRSIGRVHEIER